MKTDRFPSKVPSFPIGSYNLRGIKPEDARSLYHFMSDKEVTQFTSLHAETLEEVHSWIELMMEQFEKKQSIYWVITEDNRAIGRCHYIYLEAIHSRAEIGYYLAKEYWGCGIMTNAVTAIVEYGFEHLKLNRIEARSISRNYGSTRVLEKVGFSKEGTLRQHTFRAGEFFDVEVFSFLNTDWQQLRNSL